MGPVLIVNTTGAGPVTERVLGQAGIATETVTEVTRAAVQLAGGEYPVAVLLAGGEDAPELCAALREAGPTPLILISPGMSTVTCVRALAAARTSACGKPTDRSSSSRGYGRWRRGLPWIRPVWYRNRRGAVP